MADKDYGALLSRFLDPEETGFDTVVFQAGKPVLDSELVLDQEIQNSERYELVRESSPSGFLTGDFRSDSIDDFDFRSEANTFYLINRPLVNVNGWIFPVEFTNTGTVEENQIVLDNGPATGLTNFEADFVYLEVWRAVVGPDPSTDNKPAADKIYRHGNVLSPTATWLDDDLIDTDPAINAETTKRVQIQYRIANERLASRDNRVGYTDVNVFAQGPNVATTGFSFSQMSGDPGLWRAGDGDPLNALNTVDGYVYSIPIAIVFRRNEDGFNFEDNGNGGVLLSVGTSDRPDGLFADEIVLDDILDMRRATSLVDFEWDHVLDRNVSLLMDQELRSWTTDTVATAWEVGSSHFAGSRYLMADVLTHDSTVTDPNSGNAFRSPDGICRVFSDRTHVENHVVVYDAATFAAGADWVAGDTVSLDISSLIPTQAPSGTVISDVEKIEFDVDAGLTTKPLIPIDTATGLNSDSVTVTLGTPPVVSSRDIWVHYEVTYPSGQGLSAHVTEEVTNFTNVVHIPSEFNTPIGTTFTDDAAGRTAIRDYLIVDYEDGPHREVELGYTTDAAVTLQVISVDDTTLYLPEPLFEDAAGTDKGVVSVTEDPGGAAIARSVDVPVTGGRIIKLSTALSADQVLVEVEYFPKRPMPVTNSDITYYYKTAGIQAVNFEYLPDPLVIEPVHISQHMYVGTASSGSELTPFPYEAPMNQIPVHTNASYSGEHELSAPGAILIDDFSANTGFLKLPLLVPLAPVDSFQLEGPNNIDDGGVPDNFEYIDLYETVDLTNYRPSAFAQSLSAVTEHKVFLPVIAKLGQDTTFGREGEHVLVVFTNYLEEIADNRIGFADTNNTTAAAIYRLKGNLLSF